MVAGLCYRSAADSCHGRLPAGNYDNVICCFGVVEGTLILYVLCFRVLHNIINKTHSSRLGAIMITRAGCRLKPFGIRAPWAHPHELAIQVFMESLQIKPLHQFVASLKLNSYSNAFFYRFAACAFHFFACTFLVCEVEKRKRTWEKAMKKRLRC